MKVELEHAEVRDILGDLREDALESITFFCALISLAWLLWAAYDLISPSHCAPVWIGLGLLGLSVPTSRMLGSSCLELAARLLVLGLLGAVACVLAAVPSSSVACLFILPVVFAGVLLSQREVFLVAAAAGLLTLIIVTAFFQASSGPTAENLPIASEPVARFISSGVLLAIAIISLVTAATIVSSHSLHTAMGWVWHGYERARRDERTARERGAELRRTLKALDEATHRLERANYMLGLARDQAEEARRLKQQFAQTISHELRTPLNLVVGFVELMAESPEHYGEPLPQAYLRDLTIVRRNARHLESLVNDVLDLSRIEAAQMSLQPTVVDPADLAREAIATMRSLIEARGLTLHTQLAPGLPALWVDPTRIRQVLLNLLSNAARFTEMGSVTLSVRQQGEEVIFAVKDTGPGIAAEDIGRVFVEFHQVDASTRRRHEGAGLGLAISRRFVELHSGHIWVESEVGHGSTFCFALSAARAHLETTAPAVPVGAADSRMARGGEEPVVLAVTPSLSGATLLRRYVRGCRVVIAPDWQRGKEMAQGLLPQAVVIDQDCKELKSARLWELGREWGLPRAPFAVCPLPGRSAGQERLAVDSYLLKPVSRKSLWDVLRRFGEDVDRVLVIDDDQDFVRLLGRMLDGPVRRYKVVSAYSAQEGLDAMRESLPDLILLDLVLPDMRGAQVLEVIRSTPAWQHVPVVVVSGQDELDHQEALRGSLMVAKPQGFTPGEVAHWVQSVVETAVEEQDPPRGDTLWSHPGQAQA